MKVPGLDLDRIATAGGQSDDNPNPKIEYHLVQKMKRLFKQDQLDLLDENNYTLMLQVFDQEKTPEAKKDVEKRRIEQQKQLDHEKRFQQLKHCLYPRSPRKGSDSTSVGGRSSIVTPKTTNSPKKTKGINNSNFNTTHPAGMWNNQKEQSLLDQSLLNGTSTIGWVQNQTKLKMKIEDGRMYQNSFGVGHGFPIEGKESSNRNDWTSRRHMSLTNKYLDPVAFNKASDIASVNNTGFSKRSYFNSTRRSHGISSTEQSYIGQFTNQRKDEMYRRYQGPTQFTSKQQQEMHRKYATPTMNSSLRPGLTTDLPQIDFSRINRLRVKHNQYGTGKDVREDLLAHGGATKFFRTKRQNMIVNKPFSMFENTHLQTSGRAQEIVDPVNTTQVILDQDTNFAERYDEVGVANVKLAGISQHLMEEQDKNFDYYYKVEEEGSSPKNLKRKILFRNQIDHLNNPNKILTDKMKNFYEKTKHTGTCGLRDTSIYQASKYLERQQLKLKQIHR